MFTSVGISKSNCLVWIYGTQLENTMSFVVFAILCAPRKNILASLTTSFLVIINTAVIYSSDNSTVSDGRIVLTFGFRRSRRFFFLDDTQVRPIASKTVVMASYAFIFPTV